MLVHSDCFMGAFREILLVTVKIIDNIKNIALTRYYTEQDGGTRKEVATGWTEK